MASAFSRSIPQSVQLQQPRCNRSPSRLPHSARAQFISCSPLSSSSITPSHCLVNNTGLKLLHKSFSSHAAAAAAAALPIPDYRHGLSRAFLFGFLVVIIYQQRILVASFVNFLLLCAVHKQEALEKCWAHLPSRAAARPFTRCRYRYCRAPPAHRCPRRQRRTTTTTTTMRDRGDRYGPMEWAQLDGLIT